MPRDIFRHYRNEKLKQFVEAMPDERDRRIAVQTIHFIKTTFPECEEVLRGKLIHEEIH